MCLAGKKDGSVAESDEESTLTYYIRDELVKLNSNYTVRVDCLKKNKKKHVRSGKWDFKRRKFDSDEQNGRIGAIFQKE